MAPLGRWKEHVTTTTTTKALTALVEQSMGSRRGHQTSYPPGSTERRGQAQGRISNQHVRKHQNSPSTAKTIQAIQSIRILLSISRHRAQTLARKSRIVNPLMNHASPVCIKTSIHIRGLTAIQPTSVHPKRRNSPDVIPTARSRSSSPRPKF